ncbi:MAG: hypothetical protein A2068_01500 [Ignavibacteria bacterium GWB2_35_6b]|nr:MAG: hypothetical protein A2068_01500 [Ignavibacteria bacterium GWB2_35_6b]
MSIFISFLEIGFSHILEGYDHLLFLTGLIIVSKNFKQLLPVVTAFTIAHSTTLILSALEIISLNSLLTETLIAASIVYVGAENIFKKNFNGRWSIAFGFGLIHGAGFSGHLTGLLKTVMGAGKVWSSLIGFNIGIELGQVAVILIAFPLLFLIGKKVAQETLVTVFSSTIAAAGFVLIVVRLWF